MRNNTYIGDISLIHTRILENLLDWTHGATEEVRVERLECCAGERLAEVLASEERVDLDGGTQLRRQHSLRVLHATLQLAHRLGVLSNFRHGDTVLLRVLLQDVLDDPTIKVLAAEVGVASCREYFEHAIFDGQ